MTFSKSLDECIEASINRLSTSGGSMISSFFFDLRVIFNRQRVTKQLIDNAIQQCNFRGIDAISDTMGNLHITIDLNKCRFSPQQSAHFNGAIGYSRTIHGNDLL